MRNKELNCKDEWSEKTLYDLGTISRGKSKHRPRNDAILYNGQYPFIQTADVKSSNLYINTFSQTYNDIGLAQSKLWDKGTLCITIAANIADASILDFDACFPDSILGFTPREGISDVRFIKYCFDLLQADIKKQSKGSTQDNLSLDKLSQIKFNVPSFPTQKKIADVLSCIDDKIALNNKTNTELENMAKTIYDYWFTQFDFPDKNGHPYKTSGGQMVYNETFKREIPAGWEVKRLGDVCEIVLGGTPSTDKDEYWNGNIPWLNSGEVAEFPIINAEKTVTELGIKDSATELVPSGTVTLSITRHLRPSILTMDACINQSVVGIKENEIFSKNFLYPFIASKINHYMKLRTGAQQPHINKETVDDTLVCIPSAEVLENYNKEVGSIYERIILNAKETKELTVLRDYLLPLLMNGQIEVK